jgi:TPR repeat protein
MNKFVIVASFLALIWAGDTAAQNAQYASVAQSEFKVASSAYKDGYYGVAMRRWLELARASNGSAQYNIGLMHFYGQGVQKDPVEAYKWFLLAERNGVEKGRQAMERLARHLSPLQITEATRRAQTWQSRKN